MLVFDVNTVFSLCVQKWHRKENLFHFFLKSFYLEKQYLFSIIQERYGLLKTSVLCVCIRNILWTEFVLFLARVLEKKSIHFNQQCHLLKRERQIRCIFPFYIEFFVFKIVIHREKIGFE